MVLSAVLTVIVSPPYALISFRRWNSSYIQQAKVNRIQSHGEIPHIRSTAANYTEWNKQGHFVS